MQLPLGLVGVALGTAVYPALARAAAARDERSLGEALAGAVRLAVTLTLPAFLGLFLLAPEIQTTLWLGGKFSAESVWASADQLRAYAPCVVLQALVLLFARADYAADRQRRVVRVGLVAVAVNVVLDFVLVGPYGGTGLAFATTAATFLNVLLLVLGAPALAAIDGRRLLVAPVGRLLQAAVVMGLLVGLLPLVAATRDYREWWPAARVVVPAVLGGMMVYLGALRWRARREWGELRRLLGGRGAAGPEEGGTP